MAAKAAEREQAVQRASAAAVATAAGQHVTTESSRRRPAKVGRREADSLKAMQERIASMSTEQRAAANRAACSIQRCWRSIRQHTFLHESLRRLYSQPDMEKARKHAETFLPKDRFGQMYVLSTPFKSFHSMGW